jgi:inhibitor of cysteine peptidase
MKKYLIAIFLISSAILFSSCEELYSSVGTVKYIGLEGGFWGIIGDDGKKYDPINLPDEFKAEDLKVYFEYKIAEDQISFHMWGQLIEITKIRKI